MTKMATTNLADGKGHFECPHCNFVPSAALLSGEPAIPSQCKAVEEFLAAEAAKCMAERELAVEAACAATVTPTSSWKSSPIVPEVCIPSSLHATGKGKRAYVEDSTEDEAEESDDTRENARINPKPTGKSVFGNCDIYY
jgi:hypothetical protein